MSKTRVCCNCRHNIRKQDEKYKNITCHCEINGEWLSYMRVMTGWCKHWAKTSAFDKHINEVNE